MTSVARLVLTGACCMAAIVIVPLALAGCAGQNLNASLPLPIKSCTGTVGPDGSVTTTCEFVVPDAAPVPQAVVPAPTVVEPTVPG